MNGILRNWKILPGPSEKKLPLCMAKLFKNSNDKVGQQIHSFKGIEKKKKGKGKISVNKRRKSPW